jgi:hypothetical protein
MNEERRESTVNSLTDLEEAIRWLAKEQFAEHSLVRDASDSR